MDSKLAWATTLCALAVPILWTKLALALSDIFRACLAGGLLVAACVMGAMSGLARSPWLALNMGVGALIALVCRYPRRGGEAHRACVSLYEDIAFCAGLYGTMTCLCKAFFP